MAKSKKEAKKVTVSNSPDDQVTTEVTNEKAKTTIERLAVQSTVEDNASQVEAVEPTQPEEVIEQPESVEPEATELNDENVSSTDEQPAVELTNSVKAETHSKKRKTPVGGSVGQSIKSQNKWLKIAGLSVGMLALVMLVVSGFSSQYFKGKVMPGVTVAGISSTAKNPTELKKQIETQKKDLTITFETDGKTLKPKLEVIGFQVDVNKTVTNALNAKRKSGIFTKLAFWSKHEVPAVVTVNDTLLSQYLETNTSNLSKTPQDAQLSFDANQAAFTITAQADGQAPNIYRLRQGLSATGSNLKKAAFKVGISRKGPTITEAKLKPLLAPANDLVSRQIVLTGLGYTYKAKPADIAVWITPTPQSDGSIKLVVDSAKVQSYVESIGKKISSPPTDKKIVKDETTGTEVVLQEGRNGTELADRQNLASAIAQSLKNGQDTTQTMNITTAAFKTVNMNAYDKWIEVDLSEQRTTAYERATPIRTFIIASGVRGRDTPVGEFSIWLKVRTQTMKGGSKATGDYYDIPNVEWVNYFYQDYALHGAWWRKVFGYPASHGCVNMTNDDAHWVFDWAPVGTKVIVHA